MNPIERSELERAAIEAMTARLAYEQACRAARMAEEARHHSFEAKRAAESRLTELIVKATVQGTT
jgi:hypothetical protein